jgi:deazaflavin-dependent oxidoreductase (nitroreductase family)
LSKRRLTTALARYVVNPVVRTAVRFRLVRGWALLETTGRKTGKPRRTPVGNGLVDDTFWIVAEHGRNAGYVRNIEADPRVRVFVQGRWRSGTARVMPEDDPRRRQRLLGHRSNALFVRLMGTELLTVRVDLDPE